MQAVYQAVEHANLLLRVVQTNFAVKDGTSTSGAVSPSANMTYVSYAPSVTSGRIRGHIRKLAEVAPCMLQFVAATCLCIACSSAPLARVRNLVCAGVLHGPFCVAS